MNLHELSVFIDVCRLGSFASVAKARIVAPSSISRSIANLEENIGVRLFNRTTRKLSLTEAGTIYLSRISPLIEELEIARLEAADLANGPSGRLRITATTSFSHMVLAPLITQFLDKFPKVELDLVLTDRRVSLVDERIDLALRHGALSDSSMVSRKLMPVKYMLVASHQYLDKAPSFKKPEDLANHKTFTFSLENFRTKWLFKRKSQTIDIPIHPYITASSASALKALALQGCGVSLLADWTVKAEIESGALVQLLPDWSAYVGEDDPSIWIVYPSRTFLPSKTRAFIDFMITALG